MKRVIDILRVKIGNNVLGSVFGNRSNVYGELAFPYTYAAVANVVRYRFNIKKTSPCKTVFAFRIVARQIFVKANFSEARIPLTKSRRSRIGRVVLKRVQRGWITRQKKDQKRRWKKVKYSGRQSQHVVCCRGLEKCRGRATREGRLINECVTERAK